MSQFIDDADIQARRAEVYTAQRIEALLYDPEVDKALNGLLHGFQNQWTVEMNKETREILWIKVQGLQEFINTLRGLIDSGKMAAAQLAGLQNDQSEE